MRPLHVLVFILPLIIAYEIGSRLYLGDASGGLVENIRAKSMMLAFFQSLGAIGRFLPAAMLIAMLMAWHIMIKDKWRIRPVYLLGMAAESLLWTVPLLVLMAVVNVMLGQPGGGATGGAAIGPAAAADAGGMLWGLSREARITISIGAGIYEEMLFRLIGMALLHTVLVNLMRLKEASGMFIAVLISAALFAMYHDVQAASGGINWTKAVALMLAGAYFGMVYVMRGFGVVVAVHALYDVFVLVAWRPG